MAQGGIDFLEVCVSMHAVTKLTTEFETVVSMSRISILLLIQILSRGFNP